MSEIYQPEIADQSFSRAHNFSEPVPKKPASFVEEFSQEHSQAERGDLADDILAMKDEAEQTRYESELLSAEWQAIDTELVNLSQDKKIFSQLKKHFLLNALRQRINELNQSPLADKKDKIPALRQKISQAIIETTRAGQTNESRQAQEMIDDFYRREAEAWKNLPYDKEEVKKYFTADYLSQLSLADYTLLLQRFPASFATHVTRQGVRDHIGMSWHSIGKGEFTDSFHELIKTEGKTIKSPLEVRILDQKTIQDRLQAINIDLENDSYEQAIAKLDTFMKNSGTPGNFADRSAVHFGSNRVLDNLYGGESNNEVFYIFPSLLIANDYLFGGHAPLVYRDELDESSQWNDLFVWQKDHQGLPLDSGIVFLPKSILVDQNTGSQYALDEKRQAFLDPAAPTVEQLQEIFATPEAQAYFHEKVHNFYNQEAVAAKQKKLLTLLAQKFPQFSTAFQDIFDSQKYNRGVQGLLYGQETDKIKEFLSENIRFFWQKPDSSQTVSAQTYWENYFSTHPEHKPSKIVYYDDDPSQALNRWKGQNRLRSIDRFGAGNLGFTENATDGDDSRILTHAEKVRQQLQADIDTYYHQLSK